MHYIYTDDYNHTYLGFSNSVEVIVTEDIKNSKGETIIPKGVLAKECVSCDGKELHIYSPQIYVKAGLDTNDDNQFIKHHYPDIATMTVPISVCKYSETPWFGKVREIMPSDNKMVNKIHKQMDKDMEAYEQKKQEALDRQKAAFEKYVESLETVISELHLPEGLKIETKKTNRAISVYLYRFSDLMYVDSIDKEGYKPLEEQYNKICNFLNRL